MLTRHNTEAVANFISSVAERPEVLECLATTGEADAGLSDHAPTPFSADQIRAANARGEHTELYIFYTGHGDVERGEGYVQLRSGRLYRSKLLAHLARVSAKRTHVIIDACKSYFLVFDRGGSRRRRTLGGFLPADTPLPASTGLILSTSSAQSSHEWEAYQAGVFSHEVRSALRVALCSTSVAAVPRVVAALQRAVG